MDTATHLRWLRTETAAFAEVLRTGDHGRPVPGCPDWTLADLGRHLSGVHQWAAERVRGDADDGDEEASGPDDPAELHAWYTDAADGLVAALEAADPLTPCWTLSPPRTVAFWARRQAQEALLHRFDAEASQASGPSGLDGGAAMDGIDEALTMFFPRQVRLGRRGPVDPPVAVECAGRRWVVSGSGAGEPDVVPAATLEGPPDSLLLAIWGRIEPGTGGTVVRGDRAALDAALDGLVP